VSPFQYAILRVVPRVERGECMNAGVVLFCRPRRYLAARAALDAARLAAFAPELDLAEVSEHLDAMSRIAAGERDAGPVARLEQSERFHWLVAPSSTVIQPSPVHTGLCEDPEATLADLVSKLVA
jgi:pimeloyl-ACP methyl ester carboxylesterase